MPEKIEKIIVIPDELGGMRLDQALVKLLTDFSRTTIKDWIDNAEITVDDKKPKASQTVVGGETIIIQAHLKQQPEWDAEPIALNVVFEDDALIVINKPAGMVVHPAAGNPSNTLLNALLHHAPELQLLPRAGILHRLDKNTSGLLVIAKTASSLKNLSQQLKSRLISRIYQAVVSGVITSGGTIDEPIGRHPLQRKRMTVIETGKTAITHYRVLDRYRAHTRVKVQLETGRTHQIRVHFAHIHHPLLGDPTYNGRLQLPKGASPALIKQLRQFKRQALHACELGFIHPTTQKPMVWQAPLPDDMHTLIEYLKEDQKTHE